MWLGAAVPQSSLKKAQQERGERRKKDRLLSVTQQAKQEERRKVAQGKQPFFLKVGLSFCADILFPGVVDSRAARRSALALDVEACLCTC